MVWIKEEKMFRNHQIRTRSGAALVASLITILASNAPAQTLEWKLDFDEGAEPMTICYGQHTIAGSSGTTIWPASELDTFEFLGQAGQVVRIVVDGQSNNFDPRIELFGPSFDLIRDKFCGASTYVTCSVIVEETLTETGMHLVIISDWGSDNAGNYTLQLECMPPADIPLPLDYNTSVVDSIGKTTDVDFFTFEGVAGAVVRLTLKGTSNNFDPRLELLAPDGTTALDKSCSASTYVTCSIAPQTVTLPATGTYYVAVSDAGADNGGGYQLSMQCLVGPCPTPTWRNEGNGLAGTHFIPALDGDGPVLPATTAVVTLSKALENTVAILAMGFSRVDLPLYGGVLVPDASLVFQGLSTGPLGQHVINCDIPPGIPSGVEIFMQYWVTDPMGPGGFSASNGLRVTTP